MELQVLLDRKKIPASKEASLLMLVKVTGEEIESGTEAPPVNISLVIDRSGSMGGDKLSYVKQAARELVNRLRSTDTISLVSYDDRIEVPFPPASAGSRDRILRAIDSLTARNTTNLSGGWLKGCDLVREFASDGQVNRVILLSDGLANRGITSLDKLRKMARDQRAGGITTTTMGVGMGFNEDLMRSMAVEGGGAFYFIDNPDQAPELFQEELSDLKHIVGQNLEITIETGSQVSGFRQLNDYPFENRSGVLTYNLGEVFAGETRTQVFELTTAPLSKGETELGTVRIRCSAVSGETVETIDLTQTISVKAVSASKAKDIKPDTGVVRAALLQKTARAREKAVSLADKREFKEAAKVLKAAAEEIKASGIEDELLLDEYRRLKEEAARMDFGAEGFDNHIRKLHRAKSHHSHRAERYAVQSQALHERYMDAHAPLGRDGAVPTRVLVDGTEIQLQRGNLTVGSDPGCGIVLDHSTVEPQHCELEITPDGWIITPSPDMYPVHANGGRVRGPFRISAGDAITVGRVLLEFE